MKNKKLLIYQSVGDSIGSVEYIQHMGTDLTIVNSARVSFGKEKETIDEKDKRLIRYLIKHRHTSTLEHNSVTFRFVVPLFVRSQHMRHRTWSYNEISRRYTDENINFYQPDFFRSQHNSNRQASNEDNIDPLIEYKHPECSVPGHLKASVMVKRIHSESLKLYDQLIDAGVCREQARGVLPQNLYTEYYGTCNLNNLIKFIHLRTHSGAQWEIKCLAEACLQIARQLWPITISALINQNKSLNP